MEWNAVYIIRHIWGVPEGLLEFNSSIREHILMFRLLLLCVKQDLKNIKNVKKDVGMACQKVCKRGRDDIVKVNLQTLIPRSFSH